MTDKPAISLEESERQNTLVVEAVAKLGPAEFFRPTPEESERMRRFSYRAAIKLVASGICPSPESNLLKLCMPTTANPKK